MLFLFSAFYIEHDKPASSPSWASHSCGKRATEGCRPLSLLLSRRTMQIGVTQSLEWHAHRTHWKIKCTSVKQSTLHLASAHQNCEAVCNRKVAWHWASRGSFERLGVTLIWTFSFLSLAGQFRTFLEFDLGEILSLLSGCVELSQIPDNKVPYSVIILNCLLKTIIAVFAAEDRFWAHSRATPSTEETLLCCKLQHARRSTAHLNTSATFSFRIY